MTSIRKRRDRLPGGPVPALHHLNERNPPAAEFLVLFRGLLGMDFRVGLDPLAEDAVGDLVAIADIEIPARHRSKAALPRRLVFFSNSTSRAAPARDSTASSP